MATFGESIQNSCSSEVDFTVFFTCPKHIQFKVFALMEIGEHIRMRAYNESLKRINDQYWAIEFQNVVQQAVSDLRTINETSLLALKLSTQIYIKNGYESTFFDCLLPYLCGSGASGFRYISVPELESFLITFYVTVDRQLSSENSRYSYSLYELTLLYLLKCFGSSQVDIVRDSFGLSVHFRIKNICLGAMSVLISREKLFFLPIALATLLSAQLLKKTSGYVGINEYCDLIYGYEFTERKRTSHTNFEIFIDGSKELIDSIESWLNAPLRGADFPKNLLIEGIDFVFHSQFKNYVKDNCAQIIYMNLENDVRPRSIELRV